LPHYWETGSAFCEKHPRVEQALLSWHAEATKVEWTTPQDIKARYPTASFVGIASYSTSRGTITGYSWRPPQIGVIHIKFVGIDTEH